MTDLQLPGLPSRATPTGLILPPDLSAKEWEEIGRNLCRIGAVEVVVLGRLAGGRA